MNCRAIQSRIADLADGHLSPGNRRWVEDHLQACPACREEQVDVEAFLAECREALAYSGPTYSFAALKARMDAIQPLEEVMLFVPKLRTQNGFARFAVAMVMAVMILGAPTALRHLWAIHGALRMPAHDFDRVARTYEAYVDDPTILEDSMAPPWKGSDQV